MIPQTLTSGVKLHVEYTLPAKDGNDPELITKEIELDNYFVKGSNSVWEIGTRYYYILSIGASTSKIYFAPSAEAWNVDDTVVQLQ